ncbi:MAG: AmmeMemoRadiSam system protein A [Nitrospinota bacterium]
MNRNISEQVEIARKAIELFVCSGVRLDPADAPALPDERNEKAGTFVSLKKRGELRGCVGTSLPAQKNLTEEIICNAISSATKDPRFAPVLSHELRELDITVDVLGPPEPVSSKLELDPQKYGVIVSFNNRRGLLLPNLEGVNSVDDQIKICKRKGGIVSDADVTIERFVVTRFR